MKTFFVWTNKMIWLRITIKACCHGVLSINHTIVKYLKVRESICPFICFIFQTLKVKIIHMSNIKK